MLNYINSDYKSITVEETSKYRIIEFKNGELGVIKKVNGKERMLSKDNETRKLILDQYNITKKLAS